MLIAGWEVVSRSGLIDQALFPPPSLVVSAFFELLGGGFLGDILVSLSRVIAGLTIGVMAGSSLGLITGRNPRIDESLSPMMNVMRAFPPVALIPLIITWFGIGEGAKVFSIALAVLFPVWVNVHIGAKGVPVRYIHVAKTLTYSDSRILSRVVIPASAPFIVAGARIGIAVSFIMVYVAEIAGASHGIGYQIAVSHLDYAMDKMIAALLSLGFLAAITDFLFIRFTHRVFPWLI